MTEALERIARPFGWLAPPEPENWKLAAQDAQAIARNALEGR